MKITRTYQTVRVLLVCLVAALVIFVVVYSFKINSVNRTITADEALAPPVRVATEATSRVLLMGEVFWGRYIRDASLADELGYAYPFSRLSEFERERYDAWIAHLECPITNNALTSAQQEATLTFNCRPEFLGEAANWFDVFSLANNHTDNMGGQEGLDETRINLEKYNIQHYGHFDNQVLSELCEVVSLPMSMTFNYGQKIKKNFPIALCGFHNVFALPNSEELDVIKKYSKYFLTIITPQMGQEYVPSADQLKVDTYRAMIDRGADMVVATHPHWVQNTEVYRGSLIMYSLGNFMFDQQDSEEVRRSAVLDLEIKLDDSKLLQKWLETDLECQDFADDCLNIAEARQLEKPDFKLSYEIVSSLNTSYVTGVAPSDVSQRVLTRLNWSQTLGALVQD